MTVPMAYRRASQLFDGFLADAAQEAGLVTTNQAYTMVDGVLRVFGRRLDATEAIAFAQALPPLLRALFVEGLGPERAPAASWDRALMSREVQGLRRHHNFAPDSAIGDVAAALRRYVDVAAFDACLARLPPEAADFWAVPPAPANAPQP